MWLWQGLGVSVRSKDNKQVLESADFSQYHRSPKLPSRYRILNPSVATSCEELTVWMLWHNMEKLLGSTCRTNTCLGSSLIYAGVAVQLHCYIAFFPTPEMNALIPSSPLLFCI